MNFFIQRPIFAISIALVMILAGAICMLVLPIAQYPPLVAPQVQVSTQISAPVRLILGEDPAALLIPQPALVESQIGKQVFVVTQDNKVESRSVEVGRGYQGQWVIKKGLKKGEKVIVEGTQKVRPCMVVNTKTYSAKKASSG